MNSDDNRQLWAAYLSGELDPTEEARLIRQLEADPAFLSDAVQDAELDSLLRELGRGRQDDEERFVASVLCRLETRRLPLQSTRYPIVPPPRVLPLTDDAQSNAMLKDSLNDDSVSQESSIPIDYPIRTQPAGTETPDSNTRIWWTLVAPLAAVTLIAITIAMIRETGRVAKELEAPDTTVPILPAETVAEQRASEISTAETASRRTILAEKDGSIPAADTGSTDRIEDRLTPGEVAIGESRTEDPSTLVAGDPNDSEAGPIRNGFAVLTDSSSDVLWYHRPRPGQQGESLSLQRGTVECQLASGATVRIEAPAEFEIDSANSLLLARGCLSADVPQRAIGFTIDTPTVQIVDLGTRFETQVSSSGTVGLHVREGKVLVKSREDADETPESWVVGKDQQKFVESDGTVLDWKLEVTANVFGEITISVNGQSIPVASADDIEAIAKSSELNVIRTGGDTESFFGRYVFNDHVQDYDIAARRSAADTIAQEIAALAEIARRAQDEDGFYHVKDKQYPYSGLRDKLEARRKIARIYGPRALGGRFWPREKFEMSAGDPSSLDALQRKLIARLDFVDLGAKSLNRSLNRRNAEFEVDTPAVAHQDASSPDSDQDGVSFDRQASDDRNDLFRKLEEMRRRKGRAAEVEESAPPEGSLWENQTEEDASEGNSESNDAAATDEQIGPADASPAETSSIQNKRRPVVRMMSDLDQMVDSALEAEMLGQQEIRQELLGKVLRDRPNHPAANWHSGRLFSGRDWLDVSEAQERAKSSPTLASYKRMRAANDGSVDGNLKLARWCRARHPQASRMYYARLLDHPQVTHPGIRNEAARNLQLVSYRGRLISRGELARREEFERRYQLAGRRWDAPLEKWAKWLRPQSRDQHQQQAMDELKKVDDPDIALIAGRYASYGSESFGVHLVDTVGRFSNPESTLCLARYGVQTMWPRVRQASTIALRDREMHDYVPQLLGSLIGMTKSEGKVERLIDGTIRFEHVFRQQGATTDREQRTTRNAEPRINFSPVILGSGGGPLVRLPDLDPWTGEGERIERGFFEELARRDVSANAANAMARLSNERVYRLLSDTTGQKHPKDAIAWWNWWQDYNGIEYQKSKKTYFDHDDFSYTALDFGPRYQRRQSCFAAGTLVATETGMRPIEEIVAGDRVFAKHAETGELKLQTVLVTTVRPPTPIIELRIHDETIRTTPGHPFWVTGKGWRMAKLLQEGDQLHGMRGVLNLEQTRPLADPAPVYNLIVDEFSNYFAGSSMALVHDNTFRRPTPALIPGL